MNPTLQPSEIAAIRAAESMDRVRYPGGSVVAVDGRKVLFAAGSPEAFEPLWAQAVRVRTEVEA